MREKALRKLRKDLGVNTIKRDLIDLSIFQGFKTLDEEERDPVGW